MKALNLMMTAAAAVVMTGAAMAQSSMTASVPFGFQFGGASLPAGEYRVDMSKTAVSGVVIIQNAETKQVVGRVGIPGSPSHSSDYRPRLVFRCGDAGCVLNQVWNASSAAQFSLPKGAKPQYSASILLVPSKAE